MVVISQRMILLCLGGDDVYFFPVAFPDELFYNIIARYNTMSGNNAAIHTVNDVFQSNNCVSTIEFPSRLNMLSLSMPSSIVLDVRSIIEKNTLLNFYCAFKSPEIKKEITYRMLESDGKGIHLKLGLVSGGVNFHRYLRYCPSCYFEDMKKYGMPYFHREHQISGVFHCTRHKIITKNSSVARNPPNRQIWKELEETSEAMGASSEAYSCQTIKHIEIYAEYAKYLLENPQSKSLEWIKKRYSIILFEKGYARLNNYTKVAKLIEDLKEFFTDEYLELMKSNENFNWVKDILISGVKNPDATRHLLLLQFLNIHPKEFFTETLDLDKVDIKSYFQSEWDKYLVELIKMGKSQREICRILGTSRTTIITAIERLGVAAEFKYNGGRRYIGTYEETEEFVKKRKAMEELWINWHKENPNLNSNKIRKNHDHIYSWFLKYDKEWMKERYITKDNTSKTRVNWQERDEKLYIEARNVVMAMKEKENERITLGRVAVYLRIKGWVDRKKSKIPKTMDYLSKEIETIEEFHKRKLMQAYDKMKTEAVITYNSLFEASKINYRYKEKLREFGEELIHGNYCKSGIIHTNTAYNNM